MWVGVVGLGYVGLPLAVAFAAVGVRVVGVDVDVGKVGALGAGRSYVEDVTDEVLAGVGDRFSATTAFAELAGADAVLICVPTPLSVNREPDLRALEAAGREVCGVLAAGQLVVLESTTYPGTTRERLLPALERSGLVAGEDFHLAFSPERVDPGRRDFTLRSTPKVVGGLTEACGARAAELYRVVCDTVVSVSTPEAAELTKLLENIFRSVNIALVNELALLCDRMSIDIWEVLDAAQTKPYGFMRFDPGPGMGGHCMPVDPFYLSWRAREYDMTTEFIELAGKINQQMPYHCVSKIEHTLNEIGKPVRGTRIGLIGVAYKGGVSDTRESPALKIATLLQALGADVSYHDPHVPTLPQHNLQNTPLNDLLKTTELAVIITTHPTIDHTTITHQAPLTLDLRGITRHQPPNPNIKRL